MSGMSISPGVNSKKVGLFFFPMQASTSTIWELKEVTLTNYIHQHTNTHCHTTL